MSTIGKIARRTFLLGSAAIAGGVAFGVYAVNRDPDNPLANNLPDGAATFNPWVIVTSEKIQLITPHADKGQGVVSLQAMLIAEELDIELDHPDLELQFGQPSKAYWNTAMGSEGAPFMSTDVSLAAETMRGVMTSVFKLMGMQATGGSSSVPDSFVKLREAGAIARETLKAAASAKTGEDIASMRTENGAVILRDGTRVSYTELAQIARTMEPFKNVNLRDPSEWRMIGKNVQRTDIVKKSTGTQSYGIDIELPNMLYAAVRVNPRQGGSLKGYDANKARSMRGVSQILEVKNGVAVVANNTWRAFQAVNAIECDWGPAPYPAEQDAHWAALEASLNEGHLDSEWRHDGNVEDALKSGSVIEASYKSPYVAHAPLEPLNATVLVTDQGVEIWTGHQMPAFLVGQVAEVTGHAIENIILHNQYMGGSFGHRLEFEHIQQATHIANQMRGTPIKLTYTREEDFAHDFPRHIGMGKCSGSIENGRIKSMDVSIASPSVVGSQMGRIGMSMPGPDSQISAGAWNNPYKFENFRMRAYRATELAPVSSWRSVGAVTGGFVFDSFLDELIHAAGADPMMERIRLMEHKVSRTVLETVAEMSNWGTPLGRNKGRGVAFVESFGVPIAEVVEVTKTDQGIKIDNVWVACDVGVIIDPINFENLVQGGVVFGLGHAINAEITYSDGMAEQSNYHAHEGMRLYQCPQIHVKGLENSDHIKGIGEPPVPPAAPALANAIFAATGQRIREMPFNKHIDFV